MILSLQILTLKQKYSVADIVSAYFSLKVDVHGHLLDLYPELTD